MTELLTAAEMRAIEAAAIASGEVTGLELMERAGRGVVEAIFEEWPEFRAGSFLAVVLCGPGNNGGDGFVVARLLKDWGWEVEVYLYGDPEKLPPDARVNYERWRGMGEVTARHIDAPPLTHDSFQTRGTFALLVDAIFGTGLSRPFRGVFALYTLNEVQSLLRNTGVRRVAVDVPTGLCADSGKVLGAHVLPADLTVSFHLAKVGHFIDRGPAVAGRIRSVSICLETCARRESGLPPGEEPVMIVDETVAKEAACKADGNKYSHGHALILSGPSGKGGAARLAARGALRIGAGLVTLGCPPEAVPENAARLDAVMLRAVADGGVLAEALTDPRINALCLGPGLGLDERARGLVAAALAVPDLIRDLKPDVGGGPGAGAGTADARAAERGGPPPAALPHAGEGRPEASGDALEGEALPLPRVGKGEGRGARLVLDADALTILSQSPDLFAALHENCVLTPHAGEFARLFPDIAEKLSAPATKGPAYSKVDATREAAKRVGCVVLYKGPDTVIADPSGRCSINSAHYERAAPWLATAGSGDVLAGFITGLLARGFAPMQAAETGAWLHVECARKFGPGLIAEDLPEELPAVFRDLGL